MKYVVIDLEMNPVDKVHKEERRICRNEIIEIGAVILDEAYQEIGQFMTYVKPQFNTEITPKIRKLTGITTQVVSSAPYFEEAIEMFFSWCGSIRDDIEICQWSPSDLRQVKEEMEMKQYIPSDSNTIFLKEWTDFQREYGEKLGVSEQLSLEKALMYAGEEFEGRQHDALYDARNTANLLNIVRDEILCQKALSNVIEALHPSKSVSSSLGELFDFASLFSVSDHNVPLTQM